MKLSKRQYEVLFILSRKREPVEWGTVWDSYSWADPSSPLAMRNFDRVTDSLLKREYVAYTEGGDEGLVFITDAGRAALEAHVRAAISALPVMR